MDTERPDQAAGGTAGSPAAKQARPDQPPPSAAADQQQAGQASQEAQQQRQQAGQGDCMLFVYEREERLRLHDVVEVVGVLSVLPQLALGDSDDDSGMLGDDEQHPPTSQVRGRAMCRAERGGCGWARVRVWCVAVWGTGRAGAGVGERRVPCMAPTACAA
jgi:hypothetical protein